MNLGETHVALRASAKLCLFLRLELRKRFRYGMHLCCGEPGPNIARDE